MRGHRGKPPLSASGSFPAQVADSPGTPSGWPGTHTCLPKPGDSRPEGPQGETSKGWGLRNAQELGPPYLVLLGPPWQPSLAPSAPWGSSCGGNDPQMGPAASIPPPTSSQSLVRVSDCLHPLPQVRSDQWLTKAGGLCQAERGYGWVGWGDTGISETGPPLWSPILGPEA